jgi:hypothetical protein
MREKHKVHALPTEKAMRAKDLVFDRVSGTWIIANFGLKTKQIGINPHHLYITSDEEIKEGDKYLSSGKIVTTCTDSKHAHALKICGKEHGHVKIVATTNKELWFKSGLNPDLLGVDKNAPIKPDISKIPEDFIQAFVREQGIWEVELECYQKEEIATNLLSGHIKIGTPKLRSNGTVIIHPIKEKMYTRRELVDKAWVGFVTAHNLMNRETVWDFPTFKLWFNKNYPK